MTESPGYAEKKARFERLLTLYGRKPVLEALLIPEIKLERLHLSKRNKPAAILEEIIGLAEQQNAEIRYHEPLELSRISRNSQQDQGIAADLLCPAHQSLEEFLEKAPKKFRVVMLDGLTNPQNLGMIVRSIAASPIDGLVLSEKDNTRISPLVIKASAGALFRAPILRCRNNLDALELLKSHSASVYGLAGTATESLFEVGLSDPSVIVLGGESQGISSGLSRQIDHFLRIPMSRGVESLNVAVSAALAAYLPR